MQSQYITKCPTWATRLDDTRVRYSLLAARVFGWEKGNLYPTSREGYWNLEVWGCGRAVARKLAASSEFDDVEFTYDELQGEEYSIVTFRYADCEINRELEAYYDRADEDYEELRDGGR